MPLDKRHFLKIALLASILVFSLGFSLSSLASITTSSPIAVDFFFHLDVARVWSVGQNGMFCDFVMNINHFPYPPVFHWLLVPSVWLNIEYLFGRVLQVILFSGTLAATMILVYKQDGVSGSLFTGMLLLSNIAFIDSNIQARPQSLSMLLLPMMIQLYLSKNRLGFIISSVVMVYTHSIASLSLIYGLALHKLKEKKWLRSIFLLGLLVSPILITSVIYGSGALTRWGEHSDSDQEELIWTSPFTFVPLYMGSLLLGFPCFFMALIKWKDQTEYVKTLCLILAGSVIMIPIWADRWLQYISVPLACLAANWLTKRKRSEILFILPFMVSVFAMYQLNYWWITATGNWFTPHESTWR